MQSTKKKSTFYVDENDVDDDPANINIVSVKRSENVTITLKTVVNMWNKLPIVKTSRETYMPMRRNIWKKRFSVEKGDDDEKVMLKKQIKKLQEECTARNLKLKENDDDIIKLKEQINALQKENVKLQNKLQETKLHTSKSLERSISLQETVKNYQNIISKNHLNNYFPKDKIGILYWPIKKYKKMKTCGFDGHFTVTSKEFSIGENGYKFVMEADLNGDVFSSWSTHLSVRIFIIVRHNDGNLYWPCYLSGIIGILDTSGKNQIYFKNFSCTVNNDETENIISGLKEIIAFPEFIPQKDLEESSYLVDDTLTLLVVIYDTNKHISNKSHHHEN